ncbi:kelch-like protein 24 [Mizuhopecten yessoensis]|uniref:Kelch-like protein 24 n=1 Tax=Mizuhopecten yessoensis TaxID=6573 RepID=A0A210PN57_MIZYE|nr:kelch-like protein 24 [Mizuhopecten yessoensis]XP_021379457.1 kelch-like protein 24 [Mizuhopecten yessoensis]XP_021379458.1 kelch-like protein 24 [Mizuhopecten yessoensis]OWF37866.1 Kelch-like protein 24 [Mizuhopecten yessoensis]
MAVRDTLMQGIQEYYEANRYTDVIVQVGDQSFHCHRIVLSAVSKFFDAMYSSGMRESREDRVRLKDITPPVFKLVISYVYKDTDVLTEHTAEDLFKTSSLLQIDSLLTKCETFMENKMNSENCLGVWKLARAFHNTNLEAKCWTYIQKRFEEIRLTDEFVRLELDELCEIIKEDDLAVIREENVCDAVLRWVDAEEDERRVSIGIVFSHLRLTLLSLEYLLNELDSLQLIQSNDICAKLVRQAVKIHALPAKRNDQCHLLQPQRERSNKETVLTVIGRRLKENGERITELIAYSFAQQRWYSLHPTPPDMGEEFATCCHGDDLFITGGTSKLNSCYYFSSKLSRWRSRASMTSGRYRHCMVSVKDVLYVLGGYNAGTMKSVEEYDVRNDMWRPVGDLHIGVDASCAVALGNKIYTFGGWLGCAEETAAIQCFNTETYACTHVSNLPSPSKFTRAVVCRNRIEVLCSEGKLVSFIENGSTKLIGKIPNFYRKNFSMIRDNSDSARLLVLGGEDTYEYRKTRSEGTHHRDIYAITGEDVSVCEDRQFPTMMEVEGCYYMFINKQEFHTDYEKMLIEFDV